MTSDANMGTRPRVSIVIPVYNRERYLGEAIDSVLAQTFADWELVVSDDGSSDGTAEVASRYADADRRIRVVSGPNGGVAVARNRGLEATDPGSEYVILLDSDDLWEPDALTVLVDALDEHPDHVSAHALARSVDVEGRPFPNDDLADRLRHRWGYRGGRIVPLDLSEPTTFADMVHENWVWTPGLQLIRRRVLDRVGRLDPGTDPGDDWDLAIRISRHGDSTLVDRVVLRWRRHDATLTNQSPRWRRAYFAVRRNTLTDPTNTADQLAVARLGYVASASSMLNGARRLLRERQFGAALRQGARAMDAYARYAGLAISMRVHRSR